MNKLEITIKANFSVKVDITKTVRRIVIIIACSAGIFMPMAFDNFKPLGTPVITEQTTQKLSN